LSICIFWYMQYIYILVYPADTWDTGKTILCVSYRGRCFAILVSTVYFWQILHIHHFLQQKVFETVPSASIKMEISDSPIPRMAARQPMFVFCFLVFGSSRVWTQGFAQNVFYRKCTLQNLMMVTVMKQLTLKCFRNKNVTCIWNSSIILRLTQKLKESEVRHSRMY
jgi:hypothetical protein